MKKSDREIIYQKFGGRCAYCGCELPKKWHIDHIEPVIRDLERRNGKLVTNGKLLRPENDIISNYNPSCPSCNIMKHSTNIEGFRLMIQGFVDSLNQYSNQYKFAKKYSLIQETGNKVEFYFEKVKQ
jgi:hypothetical protein